MASWRGLLGIGCWLVLWQMEGSAADRVVAPRALTVNEGLSQNHVTTITQDANGFIWVGTAIGLNRYDGHDFRVYRGRKEQAGDLSSDAIYDLHVDPKGTLWVATDRGIDRYNPLKDSFEQVPKIWRGSSGRTRVVTSGRDGSILAAINQFREPQNLVARYMPANGTVRQYGISTAKNLEIIYLHPIDSRRLAIVQRDEVAKDHQRGFSVGVLDLDSGAYRELADLPKAGREAWPADERDISVVPISSAKLWIGARGPEIVEVDLDTGSMRAFRYKGRDQESNDSKRVTHLTLGLKGEVWVTPTHRGIDAMLRENEIYALQPNGKSRSVQMRPDSACQLSKSSTISSFVDRTGVFWQGLAGKGLCITDLESGMLSHLHANSPGVKLSDDFVRSIWKTPKGILWVGTLGGLDRIDRSTEQVQRYAHREGDPTSLGENTIKSLLVSERHGVLVGTQSRGLSWSRNGDGRFERFVHDSKDRNSLASNHVIAMAEDAKGRIWVATQSGGLQRFLPESRRFETFENNIRRESVLESRPFSDLTIGRSGELWLATEESGIYQVDPEERQWRAVDLGMNPPPRILTLREDPIYNGVIWVGTVGQGVIRYDDQSKNGQVFNAENSALPDSTVFAIQGDLESGVWLGTSRGLARLEARERTIRVFGMDQGLQSMEFNSRASFLGADGEVFLGGVGGLNSFYPRSVSQNRYQPQVAITRVRAYNPGRSTGGGMLQEMWRLGQDRQTQRFDYGNRDVIFDFVALHFAEPNRNRYEYRLDGFDKEWRLGGNLREVTYSNLRPGDYTFRVRASSSRAVQSESEAVYEFRIATPFYLSYWFYSGAACLVVGLFYGLYRRRLIKLVESRRHMEREVAARTKELSQALELNQQQAQQLRDADALKTRFLTNVSHDFRTPLTVSLGALEDLQSGRYGALPEKVKLELARVARSEQRLLRLVEQLLAIARLDAGKLELRRQRLDLAALAQDVLQDLEGSAAVHNVRLELEKEAPVPAFADADWMREVLLNLVSNAIQFSPPGSKVLLRVRIDSMKRAVCEVLDEGPGVEEQEREKIFERYFQSQHARASSRAGIGVGLSLAKEIVELHGGSIGVFAVQPKGACFRVELAAALSQDTAIPGTGDAVRPAQQMQLTEAAPVEEEGASEADRPVVLVVEDDSELQQYLARILEDSYRLLLASDGKAAWELIRKEQPDLVLSDVKMPVMDGIELCRTIRSSEETDYIPIILLSAKVQLDARLEGMDAGADDYLAKPFSSAELLAKVRNTLASRQLLRQRIRSELAPRLAIAEEAVPESAEAAFLRRVFDALREHSADPDFSIELLAKDMAMSRMHLYRRLRELLGKAPADVLVDYRLERASQLLAAKAGTVSEIAYGVGFKSVSHFSRRFRDKFHCSPTDFRAARAAQGGGA